MLAEFSKERTRKPFVTYVIISTSVILTLVNILNRNFDNFLEEDLLRLFLLPFHHGFDVTSSVLHLLFSISFFFFLGKPVEKVLGAFKFLGVFIFSYLTYIALQYFLNLQGYGLSPFIYVLSIYSISLMLNAKEIKPRVVYETLYTRLISISIAFFISSTLLFSFLPVFFDIKKTSLLKGMIDGNLIHFSLAFLGLIMLYFQRRKIRMSLLSFNKRKAFTILPKDKKAAFISLIFPIGVILVLLIFKG